VSIRRFAVIAAAAFALTVAPAFAQAALQAAPSFPGRGPANTQQPRPPFRGRSWGDLFRSREAVASTAGHGEKAAIHRMTLSKGIHRDGGPLGTETYAPYFSGSDTSLGFPADYSIWAGAERQSDCGLSELMIGYGETTGKYSLLQTIPNFDKYLHSISGLTTPTTFPWGCADPLLTGQTYKVVALGEASNGNVVGATYSFTYDDAVYVGVFDSSYNNVANHDYAVGYNIAGLVGANFVDDSYPSIAVIDTATSAYNSQAQISVLNPNGDGTYKTPVQLAADAALFGIVTGDFNGDGHVDIVATAQKSNGDYEILFYAGKGDGTFKAAVSTDTGTTERLVAQPSDVNGDGKLDIVAWDFSATAEPRVATLDAMINNGSAVFTSTLSATAANYFPVYAWDLNADGKVDLLYTNSEDNTVVVLQGDGAGHFTFKAKYPTVLFPDSSYVSDYDGDGNADILVGEGGLFGAGPVEEGTGEILLGNGDFTFSSPALPQPINSAVSFGNGTQSFAVADLNGDGKKDVAVIGNTSGNSATIAVTTFLNNYAANLANGTTVNFNLAPTYTYGSSIIVAAPLGSSTSPNSLIVAGTDTSTQQPAIQTAINSGNDAFTVKSTLLELGAPVTSLVSADFNADNKGDIAFILSDGNSTASDALYVAHGNGDGTFQAPTIIDSAVNYGGRVFTADVNADGKPDLVVSQATTGYSYVRVYLNKGTSFAAPVTFATPDGATISWIIPADFNGDGKLDLGLIGYQIGDPFDAYFYIYTGNSSATFTYASTSSLGEGLPTAGIAIDVNQDGILDLVTDGGFGPTLLLGKSKGVFYPAIPFVVPQSAFGVQAINLNSDAYPDVMFGIYNYTGGAIAPVINHYKNAPSVAKATTSVSISNPGITSQGQPLYLDVTVAETGAAGLPTGTVTLTGGSQVLDTETLGGGQVYLTVSNTASYPPGTYPLTVTYSGDNFNQPSTATINVPIIYATSLAFTVSPDAVPAGDTATLTATLTRPYGSGYPTGDIDFFYDGGNAYVGSAKLVNGVAKLTASTKGFPTGTYQLQAGYFGDSNDGDSLSAIIPASIVPSGLTGTTTALTYSPDPVTQGQTVTLTATVVKTSGSGVPTGNVKFLFGTTVLATIPLNASGKANLTANTANYYPGYYNITAVYEGNSTTFTSTSAETEIFLLYPSNTYLTVTPSTVTPGQSVTITATVSGDSYSGPSGTVKLYANGLALGTVTLKNSTGSLTASSSGIPAGTYNVTGVYSGDQYYGGSVSAPAPVTVQ